MNRWDIYWAEVPFEEDPSQCKSRPVVIVKDKVVFVLTLKITSHEVREYDPYDYELRYWQQAGLTRESVVRIRKLSQLKPDAIKNRIGRLHPTDALEIQKIMTRYKQEWRTRL